MPKPSIAVLVPFRERPEFSFIFDTWLPLYDARDRLDGCRLLIGKQYFSDMAHLTKARNCLAEMATDRQADYLLWIDADMNLTNPDPVKALELLLDDVQTEGFDIVSGLYTDKRWRKPCALSLHPEKGSFYEYDDLKNALVEVDAVGLGFCLVDARVFAEVEYPWFKCDSRVEPGEDIYFCEKAREKGFRVWVDGRVRLSHIGLFALGADGKLE